MTIAAVIQARTGSTRMANKAMLDLHGLRVLGWVIRAAQAAPGLDRVVVATTVEDYDDSVEEYARSQGCDVVRGSETDVLSRFVVAIDEFQPQAVVRLTADCPLLDPQLIGAVAALWRAYPDADLVSTVLTRTLPRGLDVELVTARALRSLNDSAVGVDRVHVTSRLYSRPDDATALGLVVSPPAGDLRVTLDTPPDMELLQALVPLLPGAAGRPPTWREVVATLRSRPDVVALNAHVRQKSIEEG